MHTTDNGGGVGSDGSDTIAEVAQKAFNSGAKIAVVTDHAEMISDIGAYFDEINRVDKMYEPQGLHVVGGVEIGLGESRHNHVLVFGGDVEKDVSVIFDGYATVRQIQDQGYTPNLYRVIHLLACQMGNGIPEVGSVDQVLKDVVGAANFCGAAVVAAHPTMSSAILPEYPFAMSLAGLTGVECFNHGDFDNPIDVVKLAVKKSAGRSPLFLTAGADYHGTAASIGGKIVSGKYAPEFARMTMVVAASDDPDSVIEALRSGHCYAVFGNARIASYSHLPGEVLGSDQVIHLICKGVDDKANVDIIISDSKGETYSRTASLKCGVLGVSMTDLLQDVGCGGLCTVGLVIDNKIAISGFRVTTPNPVKDPSPLVATALLVKVGDLGNRMSQGQKTEWQDRSESDLAEANALLSKEFKGEVLSSFEKDRLIELLKGLLVEAEAVLATATPQTLADITGTWKGQGEREDGMYSPMDVRKEIKLTSDGKLEVTTYYTWANGTNDGKSWKAGHAETHGFVVVSSGGVIESSGSGGEFSSSHDGDRTSKGSEGGVERLREDGAIELSGGASALVRYTVYRQ